MPTPTTRRVATRLIPHRFFSPAPDLGGLYAGEPEACRRDLARFLPTMIHLGLMLAAFRLFRLEGASFQRLVLVAAAALPIHYLLPYRLKKPAFVAASIVGLAWAAGPGVAAVVLPASALLIGACFLPTSWRARAAIVALMAVAVAVARAVTPSTATLDAATAVLGSMFMFRMILFLYELKHATTPERPIDAACYFFLLPNFCFLLFPVVDYRTYRRGYFAADVHELHEDGLRWMTRGMVHLLLYRLVCQELFIAPDDVTGPASLAGHVALNYLKYLHVSGQFHMACGMLHLFGFRLPETHHGYLLATSFTDYWRRINIPWKDFMVRVVFNPIAFRLKHRPRRAVLTLATIGVFVATWLLHAYQSFWLKGTWGFGVTDGLFWGILGVLVLINVHLDASRPPARKPSKSPTWQPRALAIRAAKTAAMLVTISLLWSLWTTETLGEWLEMMGRGLHLTR